MINPLTLLVKIVNIFNWSESQERTTGQIAYHFVSHFVSKQKLFTKFYYDIADHRERWIYAFHMGNSVK